MKDLNIISTYEQGNITSSTKANVILYKQQYRQIRKMLGNSDPTWVRCVEVDFRDAKAAADVLNSMSREGLYIFGYKVPAFNEKNRNSKLIYLLQSDLKKDLHMQGKIPKSRKGRLFLNWQDVLNEDIL